MKHFCLQYEEWVEELNKINFLPEVNDGEKVQKGDVSDGVAALAIRRELYLRNIEMINEAVDRLDDPIGRFIFDSVTKDKTFPYYESRGIGCGRDYFYERLHRFFWILDKIRE